MTEIALADSGLSPEQVAGVIAAMADARAPGTRKAYRSRLEQWKKWCEDNGHAPLPAEPSHIAAHLDWLASEGKSVSTINSTLAALRAVHQEASLPDPTVDNRVRKTRAGLTRRIGEAPAKQAHALSVDELRRMVATCDGDGVRGTRDKAILLIGYAGALRRSEIAALDVRSISRKRDGITLRIDQSKGDQTKKGAVVGVVRGKHTETCPVTALNEWLALTEWTSGPIFRQVTRHNSIPLTDRALTGDAIDDIVQRRARLAGLADLPITGHSLRAGHATTAAEAGVDAARIARTTRHARLETLASYVRPAEALRDSTSRDLGL